jgi:2-polyprenyl-6-methoxyphenol hydroxylase-like FAD-dependent oxidoreductase
VARPDSHAIVLGGSIAGLLAARALCDHFARVTLIERDALLQSYGHRKGVPQSLHVHGLMSTGSDVLDRLFPGCIAGLLAQGALLGDCGHVRYYVSGVRLQRVATGMQALRLSRPLLEGYLRQRLRELPNLQLLDRCDVRGLIGTSAAIRGVRITRREQFEIEGALEADLVVDATGRGSKLPRWLEALGVAPVPEERVRLDLGYGSALYRRTPQTLDGDIAVVVGAVAPNPRCGVATAIEGDRMLVTLAGYAGDHPRADHAGMIEFAKGLPRPDLYDLVRDAEPLSTPVTARFPHSQRRRYERLEAFPEGLLVVGDALCSFSPTFAQGMSVAALEAELLGRCLRRERGRELWRTYFAEAARILDTPWRMAAGVESRFAAAPQRRPWGGRLMSAYMDRLTRAAAGDAQVAQAFLRVTQLRKPASSLFAPELALRVLTAQWLRARAQQPSFRPRAGNLEATRPSMSSAPFRA